MIFVELDNSYNSIKGIFEENSLDTIEIQSMYEYHYCPVDFL